ncbi:MAG: hypothetical protein V7K25_11865 [Nostoc sp.]|uniref:hypothetical protein n=1 Tax=Nostoc sp. TaxID=1180 RepID=UPI002FF7404C
MNNYQRYYESKYGKPKESLQPKEGLLSNRAKENLETVTNPTNAQVVAFILSFLTFAFVRLAPKAIQHWDKILPQTVEHTQK